MVFRDSCVAVGIHGGKKNSIDLYIMKNKLISYELYTERLDEERLYDKYLV